MASVPGTLAAPARRRPRLATVLRRSWPAYVLLAPFLVHFFLIVAYPFLYSIYLSFFQAGLSNQVIFVGLANYAHLLTDTTFHDALRNTLIYTVIVVAAEVVLPLLLALVLNERLWGRTLMRTAIFLPVVTSWVVVSLIWQIMFGAQGLANDVLAAVHLPQQPFFADGRQAMAVVIAVTVWKDLGYYMVIYLAALQGVSRELVEAASIDGASRPRVAWHVTLPSLRPVLYFVASIATINAMQVFTQPYLMTNGGPLNATISVVQLLYREAFVQLQFGYGSAIGTVLLVMLIVLSLCNNKINDWLSR
ncbi:MAG: sugar ABC transporter permease [Candidatus Dormiibacterota bacterium]